MNTDRARYTHGARLPDRLTPGRYSCGNQMLLARLLRSMVSSSRDDVAPSSVNGALCLPTVSTNSRALRPLQIEVGEPHVKRIVPLRVQLDLAVEA